MRTLSTIALLAAVCGSVGADEIKGRKVYECRYMEDAPYGVTAWSQSEMVKTGTGKESRFVPYNSEAAKGLILDATTTRDVSSDPALKGRDTSFYMVYNSKGWYIYIHCQEPDIFVPWEGLYDRLPLDGEHWRFSLMRWGPSVTWGGKVHDTGNFGLVHFQPPTASQKLQIQKRMLRAAWFRFQAAAKKAATHWSDEKVGDLDFYTGTLKPVIDHYTALGESMGEPDDWSADAVKKGQAVLGDWMEFDYKVAELRTEYLMNKRFAHEK